MLNLELHQQKKENSKLQGIRNVFIINGYGYHKFWLIIRATHVKNSIKNPLQLCLFNIGFGH